MKSIYYLFTSLVLVSCTLKETSNTTGWDYNDPKNGGFQKVPYQEQETGPGLVLIEGGTFQMYLEQDSMVSNRTMEVIVSSFYLDEKEVSNYAYCEYLYWTQRVFGTDYPLVYLNALPDTLVWLYEGGKMENYVNLYLRHPAYSKYPVVGVNWMQANNYCSWRTDRVNEFILIREGVLSTNPNQINEDHFNTMAYIAGQYEGYYSEKTKLLPDLNPTNGNGGKYGVRQVRLEDGILLPNYRLPTEAEWEYAASAGTTLNEKKQKKLNEKMGQLGQFVNPLYAKNTQFNAYSVVPVDAFVPNDLGLYNMSGNVSEWVQDSYARRTETNISDFEPVVGSDLETPVSSLHYNFDEKLSYVVYDLKQFEFFLTELKDHYREELGYDSLTYDVFQKCQLIIDESLKLEEKGQYRDAAQKIDILTNEFMEHFQLMFEYKSNEGNSDTFQLLVEIRRYLAKSIIDTPGSIKYREISPADRIVYRNEHIDLSQINENQQDDLIKVYKGANWKDSKKWISPNYRRSLNKYDSKAFIGFRCAMDRVGSPIGLGKKNK